MWKVGLLLVLAFLFVAGCEYQNVTDPNGVTHRESRIDPNAARTGESLAAGTGTILGLLEPLIGPVGGVIGGIIITLLGAWRKIAPVLTTYRTERDQYYAVASTGVTVIDELKKMDPKVWAAIKPKIEELLKKFPGMSVTDLENVILGLRGLPQKTTPTT